MSLKKYFISAVVALSFASATTAADVKVGFVYVGPIGDGGWTYEHDKGRLAVEKAFGDKVETIYQEMVPEGADSERVMTQMALQGADLIFTTSFGYMDPTINVAKKFPKVKFEHATGFKRSENVSTYSARLRGACHSRPYCWKNDKNKQNWLYCFFPDPRSDPRHQLSLYPCKACEPKCGIQNNLGLYLV